MPEHPGTRARTKLVLEFWTPRRELRENRKRLLTRISDAAGLVSLRVCQHLSKPYIPSKAASARL
jgi:hypothetical protein